MKNQKGVTAISMVIVIVIIIMLAGFSLLTSRDVVVETNVQSYYQEMSTLNESLKRASLDKKTFRDTFELFKIDNIEEYNFKVGNNLMPDVDYYFLPYGEEETTDILIQSMNEVLDVRNVKNSYIFSYVDTGKVDLYLLGGVRVGDETIFSYSEIREEYSSVTKK